MTTPYDFLIDVDAFDDLVVNRFLALGYDEKRNAEYVRIHHLKYKFALKPDKFYDVRCLTTNTMLRVRYRSVENVLDVEDGKGAWNLVLGCGFRQDHPFAYLIFPKLPPSDDAKLHHYAGLLKMSLPIDAYGDYEKPKFIFSVDDNPLEFVVADRTVFEMR